MKWLKNLVQCSSTSMLNDDEIKVSFPQKGDAVALGFVSDTSQLDTTWISQLGTGDEFDWTKLQTKLAGITSYNQLVYLVGQIQLPVLKVQRKSKWIRSVDSECTDLQEQVPPNVSSQLVPSVTPAYGNCFCKFSSCIWKLQSTC